MNYEQAIGFLERSFVSFQTVGKAAYKGGLESITAICEYLGNPQNNYPSIHVAGTNGKGSVSHMLASVFQAAGYRVGLYTSPHLRDFRERIRIDGEPVTEDIVARFVTLHGKKMVDGGLSYFEMTTAMAFDCFSDAKVDIAIIETGLGGRLDATNIVTPLLSVITNAGLDHTDILGDTLPQIACEKAGIIKCGIPAVIGESNPETDPIFKAKAAGMSTSILFADKSYICTGIKEYDSYVRYILRNETDGSLCSVDLGLMGEYQRKNVVTVMAAIDMLRSETSLRINDRAVSAGLRDVKETTGLLGRWHTLSTSPLVIADTGHNSHAIRYIGEQLARRRYGKLYIVIGFAKDKAIAEVLPLLPQGASYIFTQADSPRAMDAAKLAEVAAGYGLYGEVIASVTEALAAAKSKSAPEDMIFIGGSTFVVAEVI